MQQGQLSGMTWNSMCFHFLVSRGHQLACSFCYGLVSFYLLSNNNPLLLRSSCYFGRQQRRSVVSCDGMICYIFIFLQLSNAQQHNKTQKIINCCWLCFLFFFIISLLLFQQIYCYCCSSGDFFFIIIYTLLFSLLLPPLFLPSSFFLLLFPFVVFCSSVHGLILTATQPHDRGAHESIGTTSHYDRATIIKNTKASAYLFGKAQNVGTNVPTKQLWRSK